MTSLFLNTFSSYLHIAILKNNKLIKQRYQKLDKELSKMALQNIKELFDELNIKPNDISNIVCVEGPGSFTGLRVGVTIAKTYSYSLNIPLIAVSSLFVMATSVIDSDYIIPLIDARRGYVYAGIYDKSYNCVLSDQYLLFTSLKEQVNKLNGTIKYVSYDLLNEDVKLYVPNIENTYKYLIMNKTNPMTFIPNYLKKTEAEENL